MVEKEAGLNLKWQRRKTAGGERLDPYWHPPAWATKDGFPRTTVPLREFADNIELMHEQCRMLNSRARIWLMERGRAKGEFSGTLGELIGRYQRDPESPYQGLRPGTLVPYKHYLAKLEAVLGAKHIDEITGSDIRRWHNVWSDNGKHLAAAAMQRAILDAVATYGVTCRLRGCAEFQHVLRETKKKLPMPKPREATLKAPQIVAAREAAHKAGRPSSALAYALAFETTLRLWDIIGQWWSIEDDFISDVVDGKRGKWFGLRWDDIDGDMVLRFTPSKTSAKSGASITYPLAAAPMVMEELAHWPEHERVGPVIVNEATGLPYPAKMFTKAWRADREAAGIPSNVWVRDMRASGISEARAGGVSTDDAAKVAGHASTRTTAERYDRANLEASHRFADARVKMRETKK